jgi:hypothetical protein
MRPKRGIDNMGFIVGMIIFKTVRISAEKIAVIEGISTCFFEKGATKFSDFKERFSK